jgi:hypothetical protein
MKTDSNPKKGDPKSSNKAISIPIGFGSAFNEINCCLDQKRLSYTKCNQNESRKHGHSDGNPKGPGDCPWERIAFIFRACVEFS